MKRCSIVSASYIARLRLPDIAAGVIIILAGWIRTLNIERFIDIDLLDETRYLRGGISIPVKGFPSPEWAPLYSVWYYLLSFIQPDKIKLLYLNYRLMVLLPALALFVLLRINKVDRAIALALSVYFVLSAADLPVWPKVSHFALILLLSGLIVMSLLKTCRFKVMSLVITALLASYVRPELLMGFILLAVMCIFITIREYRRNPHGRVRILPVLALFSGLALPFYLWGIPFARNRLLAAFGQHYALNWVRWHNVDRSSNPGPEYIRRKCFGNISNPAQAFLSNPILFLRHVFSNVVSLPDRINEIFWGFSKYDYDVLAAYRVLTVSLSILTILIVIIGPRRFIKSLRIKGPHLLFLLFSVFLLSLPEILACVFIYPRRHYILIIYALWASFLTISFFRNYRFKSSIYNLGVLSLLAVCLIVMRPMDHSVKGIQPDLYTVYFVKSLHIKAPVSILGAEANCGVYLGDNYRGVSFTEKNTNFFYFIDRASINMINVSERIRTHVRFRNDPEWVRFIENPGAYGFTRLDIANIGDRLIAGDRFLLVKRELLSSSPEHL